MFSLGMNSSPKNILLAHRLLRLGLAFVFLYAAIEMLIIPESMIKYVPAFVGSIMPLDLFLQLFGGFEILLAFWLLSGWLSLPAAWIAFVLLTLIVITNLAYFPILFRNVAISCAALALAALSGEEG